MNVNKFRAIRFKRMLESGKSQQEVFAKIDELRLDQQNRDEIKSILESKE